MFRVAGDLMGRSRLPLAPNTDDSPADLAERFSAHYVAKITQLHSRLTVASVPSHPPPADNNECSVTEPLDDFQPATVEAISKLSMAASGKVCPRIDVLTAVLLKSHMTTLAPVLTRLVNSSIESSTVPAAMKHAIITPLLKKAGLDVDDLSCYRPISKLSFVSKILEKHIAIQIQDHMETHDLFDAYQSAYRPHHSCETAIVRIQDDILKSLDSRKYVILVLLDLSSAFDSVDHDILMNKLYKIGVRGRAYNWVKSYLSSRTQAVEIGEAISKTVHLHCGVPQGSVLGPILFNIYCLDLADVFRDHSVHYHMYADDTQLYVEFPNGPLEHSTSDAERMSRCITDVKTWLTQHKLALNDKKTEAIRITTVSTCHPRPAVIHVGALAVQSKPHVRDIGIVLDDTMTMAKHASHTCRTAYYHLHNIASIRRSLTTSACKIIVHSLVVSRLDFGNATLYGISEALLHRLQVLQNSAARLITGTRRREHISPVLFALHWLPIRQRIKFKLLLLVYRCLHQLAPAYLSELIKPYTPARSLRSADSNLITTNRYRLEGCGRRRFSVAGPLLWNQLPASVKSADSIGAFKTALKTHLFREAFMTLL